VKIKSIQLFTISDKGESFRKRYPSFSEKILRLLFIVSEANGFFWIELFDIEEISGVISEDSKAKHSCVQKINLHRIVAIWWWNANER
jgi:hypothetical protein